VWFLYEAKWLFLALYCSTVYEKVCIGYGMCYTNFLTAWTRANPSVYHEVKTSEMHNVAGYKYGIVRPCAVECAPTDDSTAF